MPCGTDLCTAWHSCCSVQPCKDSFVDLLISSCKLPEDPVQRVNGEQLTFLQLYPLHSRWVCTCVNMPTQFLPVLMATYSGAWPTLWCWMQTLACVHQWSDALNHTTGPLSSVWLPGRTQQATCGHMWTHLCTAGHRAVLCAWALASSCKAHVHVCMHSAGSSLCQMGHACSQHCNSQHLLCTVLVGRHTCCAAVVNPSNSWLDSCIVTSQLLIQVGPRFLIGCLKVTHMQPQGVHKTDFPVVYRAVSHHCIIYTHTIHI
jgi:hypothetical protein